MGFLLHFWDLYTFLSNFTFFKISRNVFFTISKMQKRKIAKRENKGQKGAKREAKRATNTKKGGKCKKVQKKGKKGQKEGQRERNNMNSTVFFRQNRKLHGEKKNYGPSSICNAQCSRQFDAPQKKRWRFQSAISFADTSKKTLSFFCLSRVRTTPRNSSST